MNRNQPTNGVIMVFRPRESDLLALVRLLSRDSINVRFTHHARERMVERGISDKIVFDVLLGGDIMGSLENGREAGEYKLKLVKTVRGLREVGVVALTVRQQFLVIKTVEWEDAR